ncbi:MAG: pyrimidine 5'-nucleotidase [Acidithiobacillaceae bacterium]|nr:pyrimidine 5'-nucleotidase [Acidithiobacillaceae bacterium]MBU2747520.1 pyrimidine 5'-nucleotidase [Acidithiobacillus montserratensis]
MKTLPAPSGRNRRRSSAGSRKLRLLAWRRKALPVFLFDLDNTLYDADRYCFPWMHTHINAFLMRELGLEPEAADQLRRHYWRRYGTTLAGLLRHHPVDPRVFLEAIHPPALSADVPENMPLRHWLIRLPGPIYVFTNSVASHAWRVLERLQVADLVEDVFDMESAGFQGKPHHHAYRQVLRRLRIPAWRCVFFDDTLVNLRTARWMGMQTVHIEKKRRRARSAHQQVRALLSWEHCAVSPKTFR